ncbi:hypothetical protein H0H81_010733 [Sphagnurus paluster]|uniref:GH16 domain-containing protein n=1 Tax=Sphagnurus paluster TaxID=117069 RepID=A0A9P7FUZ3_9AGAR|nr:hypothetical protein H0H81_010733 [Sphagnurus paluster]
MAVNFSPSLQYSLSPSPAQWGMQLNIPEPDDDLHNPDSARDRQSDRGGVFTSRGLANLGCLFILGAGFPILTHFLEKTQTTQGGFNLGGINGTGQIADIPGNWGLIDRDTPKEAYTKSSYLNKNDKWVLVFSDEFNQDGRSFYPGDDPYWEAVDLHYWGTNDLEWYDPSGATTSNGSLKLKLERVLDPANNHNLSYKSGMVQTWNKFCFTGGLIEVFWTTAACTCPGESHPGPVRADGTYVGRAAPEIDIFEAIVEGGVGKVSLSSQWAPFNAEYSWFNTSDNLIITDPNTVQNPYQGGVFQQTTSGLALTNQDCYEFNAGCFTVYGFQYKPGCVVLGFTV